MRKRLLQHALAATAYGFNGAWAVLNAGFLWNLSWEESILGAAGPDSHGWLCNPTSLLLGLWDPCICLLTAVALPTLPVHLLTALALPWSQSRWSVLWSVSP